MRKNAILPVGIILVFIVWAGTFSNDLTIGVSGAPGDGSCGNCHTGSQPFVNGTIQLNGLPANIVPDTWYTLTVGFTSDNPEAITGFQFVALNNNGNSIGTFGATSSNVEVSTIGGRTYAQHDPATGVSFPALTASYSFQWKAPVVAGATPVNFFVGGTVGNPDNIANSLDLALSTSATRTIVPPISMVSINSSPVSCNGQNDGSAQVVVVGGVAPIAYQWSNGSTNNTINNLAAGTYSVTVTDNVGQSASTSVTIQQPAPLFADVFAAEPIDCAFASTGSLSVAHGGGTGPYSFNWSNGAQGQTINNLGSGAYSVTVMDANECMATDNFFLSQPTPIVAVPTFEPVSCFGSSDGVIDVDVFGGSSPYSFLWSNGESGALIDNLAAGNYQVTIEDALGCELVQNYSLNSPAPILVEVSVVDVSCANSADGQVEFTIDGGQAPYEVVWSDGFIGPIRSDLAPGSYSVTIEDANDCSEVVSLLVDAPLALEVMLDGVSPSAGGAPTGSIEISVIGGTPPYQYSWEAAGFPGSNEEDLSDLSPGAYTLNLVDANGCSVLFGPIEVENINGVISPQALGLMPFAQPVTNGQLDLVWRSGSLLPQKVRLWSHQGRLLQGYPAVEAMSLSIWVGAYQGLGYLELVYDDHQQVLPVLFMP